MFQGPLIFIFHSDEGPSFKMLVISLYYFDSSLPVPRQLTPLIILLFLYLGMSCINLVCGIVGKYDIV